MNLDQGELFPTDSPLTPTPTHVLSFGLGADSTAVLLRWLIEPSSRDFDLADLVS